LLASDLANVDESTGGRKSKNVQTLKQNNNKQCALMFKGGSRWKLTVCVRDE
jgi:hypothetical protein